MKEEFKIGEVVWYMGVLYKVEKIDEYTLRLQNHGYATLADRYYVIKATDDDIMDFLTLKAKELDKLVDYYTGVEECLH